MRKLLIVFTPARRAKLQLRPQRVASVVHCERVAAVVDRDVRSSSARRTVASSLAQLGTLRWHAAGHATTSWCMCATASVRPRPSRLQPQPDAVVCCTMATSPALSRAAVGLAEWRADRPRVLMRQHGSARGLADVGSLVQQSAPLPAKPINMAASSVACMRSKPCQQRRRRSLRGPIDPVPTCIT